MGLQESILEEVQGRRENLLSQAEELRAELADVEGEIREADELIEYLTRTKVKPKPAEEPKPEQKKAVSVEEAATRLGMTREELVETLDAAEQPNRQPVPLEEAAKELGVPLESEVKPEPKRRAKRVPGSTLRAEKPLDEWVDVIGREFGNGGRHPKPFTVRDLATAMNLSLTPSHVEAARQVINMLIERGELRHAFSTGRTKKFAVKVPVTVAGPGDLERLQEAWDAQEARDSVQEPPTVDDTRGTPVAGTGEHSPQRSALNALQKDLRDLIAPALRAGWVVGTTGSGHVKVRHPHDRGRFFTVASTPSDVRAIENVKAQMRGAGAPLS